MAVLVYNPGVKQARELIAEEKVDKASSWEITPEDENEILGDPPDWEKYARWHLAEDTSANKETKARWKFPYGKNGKVYRRALIAAKARASQQGYKSIAAIADELLRQIDGEEARTRVVQAARIELQNVDESQTQLVQLLPWGLVKTLDGREFLFDEFSAEKILSAWASRTNDLPVDYGHESLMPWGTHAPAAGWIVALQVRRPSSRDDVPELGLWAEIAWTNKAFQAIKDREYRYISPVLRLDDGKPPRAVELLGAGITIDPAIDGMLAVASRKYNSSGTMEGNEMILEKFGFKSEKELAEALERAKATEMEVEKLRKELAEQQKKIALDRLLSSGKISHSDERLISFAGALYDVSPELFAQWCELLPNPSPVAPPQPHKDNKDFSGIEKILAGQPPEQAALVKRAFELRNQRGLSYDEAVLLAAKEMEGN